MADSTRSLAVGERLGDYQIVGRLGAGGMGVVYKALDLKLQRTVALKFLPHDLNVGEKEKQRFLQEARTASALDHPNIGAIYSLEETSDGHTFIVMACYEGQNLAQRLEQGPLPAAEAVEIAIQMARGLAEAHERNIIHRDVKPSNVLLTPQNVVKIVDFGLARVAASASATQSVGMAGTVAYMSPEQALGEALDARTDVWSLGVVLAEMLTRRNPFHRDTTTSVLIAVINQPPAPLEGVPQPLQAIIYRALSKDRAHRYQSCRELLADLESLRATDAAPTQSLSAGALKGYVKHASRPSQTGLVPARPWRKVWLAAAAVLLLLLAAVLLITPLRERLQGALLAGGEKRIAVLPFASRGGDAADPALVEGLMDSLTSKLSNLEVGNESLWVVPASEVRRRKIDSPGKALEELGATLVVEGSIQRQGKSTQLLINLVNTRTLRQIGSVPLEDHAGDLATLQDEAVARLARLMNVSVTAEMLRATGGSVQPAAYESYLQALGYMQRYDRAGNLDRAMAALNDAVKADPRFALGHASLGEAYRLKYQLDRDPKWLDEAAAHCARAQQLNDRLPAVYVTMGRLHSLQGKYDLALQGFERALELNARDADATIGLAGAYERMGRLEEAEAAFQRAVALRPDYWDGYNSLGLFYIRRARFDDAAAQFRRVIELTPDNSVAHLNLASALIRTGDPAKMPAAEEALKKSIEITPSYPAYANLGFLYMGQKKYAESAAATEKALEMNDKDFRVWSNLALAYEWLENEDQASAAREQVRLRLEQTVQEQPQNAMLQSALATVYARQKQPDKALARARSALALGPDDPQVLIDVASTYEHLGDRRRALQYVHQALEKGYALDSIKLNPAFQALLADPNFNPGRKK